MLIIILPRVSNQLTLGTTLVTTLVALTAMVTLTTVAARGGCGAWLRSCVVDPRLVNVRQEDELYSRVRPAIVTTVFVYHHGSGTMPAGRSAPAPGSNRTPITHP